jgi:hypothetical protein
VLLLRIGAAGRSVFHATPRPEQIKREEKKNMIRRVLAIVCCFCVLAGTALAEDPPAKAGRDSSSASRDDNTVDVTAADMKGIPKHNRYFWATLAGGALGAGIGALLPPGSGKSAAKGALIGGGLASSLWLGTHKNDPSKYRPFAWIVGNAVLVGGVGWTICNCGKGFPIGALIGGGFTGAVQVFEPRGHKTISKITGAGEQQTQQQQVPQQQPPTNPPPQTTPPDQQPPQTPPPTQPPQETAPPDSTQAPPDNPQTPPDLEADVLPDNPQPKVQQNVPPPDRM